MGEGATKAELQPLILLISMMVTFTVLVSTCPSELLPTNADTSYNTAVSNPYFQGVKDPSYVDLWDFELWPGNAVYDYGNGYYTVNSKVGGWSLQLRWDGDYQWIDIVLLSDLDHPTVWNRYYLATGNITQIGENLNASKLPEYYDSIYKVAAFRLIQQEQKMQVDVYFNYSITDYADIYEAFGSGHLWMLVTVQNQHVNLYAGRTDVWAIIAGLFTFSIPDVPWPIQVILSSVWWATLSYLIAIFIIRLVPFT